MSIELKSTITCPECGYKKEEIMVAIALEQLECPRVDLDYRDQNGISIVEYAAARDIPRINQVIRRIRPKKNG